MGLLVLVVLLVAASQLGVLTQAVAPPPLELVAFQGRCCRVVGGRVGGWVEKANGSGLRSAAAATASSASVLHQQGPILPSARSFV